MASHCNCSSDVPTRQSPACGQRTKEASGALQPHARPPRSSGGSSRCLGEQRHPRGHRTAQDEKPPLGREPQTTATSRTPRSPGPPSRTALRKREQSLPRAPRWGRTATSDGRAVPAPGRHPAPSGKAVNPACAADTHEHLQSRTAQNHAASSGSDLATPSSCYDERPASPVLGRPSRRSRSEAEPLALAKPPAKRARGLLWSTHPPAAEDTILRTNTHTNPSRPTRSVSGTGLRPWQRAWLGEGGGQGSQVASTQATASSGSPTPHMTHPSKRTLFPNGTPSLPPHRQGDGSRARTVRTTGSSASQGPQPGVNKRRVSPHLRRSGKLLNSPPLGKSTWLQRKGTLTCPLPAPGENAPSSARRPPGAPRSARPVPREAPPAPTPRPRPLTCTPGERCSAVVGGTVVCA